MIDNKNDATPKMKTLSESVNEAVENGYKENFQVGSKGLTTGDKNNSYAPMDIAISSFYRFEGYSDPQDNAILYLIKTNDGRKGTLIDAYGAQADATISKFVRDVEDIQKKKNGV